MKNLRQFILPTICTFALVTSINISDIHAEETTLPFIEETEIPEEVPTKPFMPNNPPCIQIETAIDAQGYQITSPITYIFNIKDEDGIVNEDFTIVLDPNEENSGIDRIFLDYGTYTITQVSADNLDNYTYNGTTYHNNSQQIVVSDDYAFGNYIPYSILNHYIENALLSSPIEEETVEPEKEATSEIGEKIINSSNEKETISSEKEEIKAEETLVEEKTNKDESSQPKRTILQADSVRQTNITKEQTKKIQASLSTKVIKSSKSNKDEDMQQMANKNTKKAKNPISLANISLLVVALFILVSVAFKKYLF